MRNELEILNRPIDVINWIKKMSVKHCSECGTPYLFASCSNLKLGAKI